MNQIPLMVNATLGTTVQGAIDPISDIQKICEKHKVWLHVDACVGGSKVFIEEIEGIDKIDSIACDPHKHW